MNDLDFVKDDEALNERGGEASFALNQRTFRGQKLNKFTLGHRIVLNQIREEGDSVEFFIWSTIFSLIKTRQEIVDLAWNKTKFRSAVIDWVDTMKASDFEEAVAIVNSIYEEINGTSVMITGDADSDKKK
jgi:hypothetical protein